MQVTFLQPEERQLFRGTAIWREDAINGFPRNRVYSAYIKNGGSKLDPEEVFDMSGLLHIRRARQNLCALRVNAAQVCRSQRSIPDHAPSSNDAAAWRLLPFRQPLHPYQPLRQRQHRSRRHNPVINTRPKRRHHHVLERR